MRLCFCLWHWNLKSADRQSGRKDDVKWGKHRCVRMRQKLQGCLGLQLDSQLSTSLQVSDAGDLQDTLVTLARRRVHWALEELWVLHTTQWNHQICNDICGWQPYPMPIAIFEHKKNMAASFLPSESETEALF